MKYRFSASIIAIAILLLTSITVCSVGYEYTLSPNENFIFAKSGDDLTEISKTLNTTPKDLNTYFAQNGLIYLAVSPDGKTQIKISAFNDNFSSAVNDISYLDDTALTEFANTISEDSDSPALVVINNGRKFICVKTTRKDSGGIYTVTQYITICNNKTFYFAGYNIGEETSAEISDIFSTFTLQEKLISSPKITKQKEALNRNYILTYCGVAVFVLIAVISAVGIIKIKSKKETDQNEL